MHALVDQLTTTGALGLRAPFPVVAEPAAVAVARAKMHQRSVGARVDLGCQVVQGGVKAMVEPDLDPPPRALGSLAEGVDLPGAERRRLLYEDMAAGLQRPMGQRRELIMGGGHHDHVRTETQQVVEVGAGAPAVLGHEPVGTVRDGIDGAKHAVAAPQRPGTLAADQTASSDRDGEPWPVGDATDAAAHVYSLD